MSRASPLPRLTTPAVPPSFPPDPQHEHRPLRAAPGGSYFIPEIDVLFVRAGAGLTPEQIGARAGAWLFWDRIRLVLIVAA